MELDLTDPFEAVAWAMVVLNRKKRADYAEDGDPWSNFRKTAEVFGWGTPRDAVRFNIVQKLVRLDALNKNHRDPVNESVQDTWVDLATYGAIGAAMAHETDVMARKKPPIGIAPPHILYRGTMPKDTNQVD